MPLWLVRSYGMGMTHAIVRAKDEAEAKRLAHASHNASAEEIDADGPAAVLWECDVSLDDD